MPHKNTIRKYFAGGYYHVYNRGVEKRAIFQDGSDYTTFISLLESYLTPKEPLGSTPRNEPASSCPWRSKLKKDEVELIGYCIMPNHFHLLIKQNESDGVTKFMRRISTSYAGYFNKKYRREGTLFQGKFKAALIENDSYLLHLSRYIHLNPLEVGPLNAGDEWLLSYPYSSYKDYVGKQKAKWIRPKIILDFFKNKRNQKTCDFKSHMTYQSFVQNYKRIIPGSIKDLILETETI